jgi:hypothetical protein
MRRIAIAVMLAATGCYSPRPLTQCGDSVCTADQSCDVATVRCVGTAVDASSIDSRLVDGCTPTSIVCGDGIDQNCDGTDELCPSNDKPANATNVSAGGVFSSVIRFATDDAPNKGCGLRGGRDVFFEMTLVQTEVIYFDTFESDFDSTLRVYSGTACQDLATAALPLCTDNSCAGVNEQFAVQLPQGKSCVVVDKVASANEDTTVGSVRLTVTHTGQIGALLTASPTPIRDNTCNGTSRNSATTCSNVNTSTAKDISYFVLGCPSQRQRLDVSTCATTTTYDSVLTVEAGGTEQACNDDTNCVASSKASALDTTLFASPIYFVVVDGLNGACGPYDLSYQLTTL